MVLGKILNRLKNQNLYENTVIFMMSDHGLRVWSDLYNHVHETALFSRTRWNSPHCEEPTSKDLGLRMTKELDKIISGADANKNGSLERDELATIITSRLKAVE